MELKNNMKMIFGLGNPEQQFNNTPHNCGFFVVDKLANEYEGTFSKKKMQGVCAEIIMENEKVLLIKPQTYMNNSGECIQKYVKKFKIPLNNILVISDDIDLPAGTIRFRQKGSAGSHNGLKSVVSCLKTTEFPRLRVGVGKPPEHMDLADFVLSKLPPERKELIEGSFEQIKQKITDFVKA